MILWDRCHKSLSVMKSAGVSTRDSGKLKERKITLQAKHNVKPPIQEASRIQFSLRSKVEEKIAVLEALAEGRTSFVNPIVVVPKLNSSDIRLCVDCPPVRGLLSDV